QKISADITVPGINNLLSFLGRQGHFWETLALQRSDKVAISTAIVEKHIKAGDTTIILDSGTTVEHVPFLLSQRGNVEANVNVKVYTNNLLAAVSVVPPPENFNCTLLAGRIDPIYGATYNTDNIEAPYSGIQANVIILAAKAISFNKGPMVAKQDDHNREFKKGLIGKALQGAPDVRLIIAVDWTKLSMDVAKRSGLRAVLSEEAWENVKNKSSFVLVTTEPPELKLQ
ncbi:unnamed protein product, partial [marine sediment metagenome]